MTNSTYTERVHLLFEIPVYIQGASGACSEKLRRADGATVQKDLIIHQGNALITYRLKGIAEGLAGFSYVKAKSVEEIFAGFPLLQGARHKIHIDGSILHGAAACDG